MKERREEEKGEFEEDCVMAGLFDKQAEAYAESRPTYPKELYEKLAGLTPRHALAWDVGTGNGQAAIGVAEHFEQVIATDVSEPQLKHAIPHPRVRYIHTPLSLPDDELVDLLGGENSVDLITVAQAVHWFDLPKFYAVANRLLRKPGGILAVWAYHMFKVSPLVDPLIERFGETTMPYWHPNAQYVFDEYRTLPFPFESVGLGSEQKPITFELHKETSFNEFVRVMKSFSAVTTAKERGVDLVSEGVVKELESAWGRTTLVRPAIAKGFMLAGRVRM